ncbi:hypothetical protein [Azospirillum oleiclasticum]|uniref:Uncharacterized protein n=1 Tax=Azospirillum oleiclasticum TaxID=2735135 RepID=A0ABX2TN26_9PROT|nr:hypothetical protein [Azospirillum oleiclasticum]NYZ24560.1 hypothetical protein [Azospirillum oleiclasticum]
MPETDPVEPSTAERRARIRAQSAAVAEYVRSSPDAQAFYEDWGTPNADFSGKPGTTP